MPPVFAKPLSKQSAAERIRQDISILAENVRNRKQSKPSAKRTAGEQTDSTEKKRRLEMNEPTIPVIHPTAYEQLSDNPYAKEIFMSKTNVQDLARDVVMTQKGPLEQEKRDLTVQRFRDKLYRFFANDPKWRIKPPLDRLRFESQYYEYRFYVALHKPLRSEEEYQDYREQLKNAGVKECWVRMRKRNLLLKHEDTIVSQAKQKFVNWGAKLEKLETYLAVAQKDYETRHPKPQKEKISSADEELLDAIMNHSNARLRMSSAQIKNRFERFKQLLEQTDDAVRLIWLRFDDDELNRRYKLDEKNSLPASEEPPDAVPLDETIADSGPSETSQSSEIVQMQSEMAMTQPVEVLPMAGSFFTSTEEMITVLDTPNMDDPLPVDADAPRPMDVPPVETPILENNTQRSASPESRGRNVVKKINFAPVTPAEAACRNEIANHRDTPALPEIVDVPCLDYLRRFTNIDDIVINEINKRFPQRPEKYLKRLDKFVAKYYEEAKEWFAKKKWPPGLRQLTKTELDARKNVQENQLSRQIARPPSMNQKTSLDVKTPRTSTVPLRSRAIQYEEDNSPVNVPPADAHGIADISSVPDSENFWPTDCSTQVQYDAPVPLRQAIPSPTRPVAEPRPSSPPNQPEPQQLLRSRASSAASTASESDSTNVTVLSRKVPDRPVRVKLEKDLSGYEGEVEFCGEVENNIVIEDSPERPSQIDANELIERYAQKPTDVDGSVCGVPSALQGMVNALFQEDKDNALTQSSSASGGSGGALTAVGSTLGQELEHESAPVGFRNAAVISARRNSNTAN